MVVDVLESFRKQLLDRVSSPIIGSFLVSWCLWNYKFLVILFSSASVSTTFSLIEKAAFPDTWSIVGRGLLYPFLTAAVYIFLYPYPARFVYGFTQRRQRELNALRQQIENETLLSVEESRRIRADVVARDTKHDEELDRLNTELARLRSELAAAQSSTTEVPSAPQGTSETAATFDESQIAIMKEIEKAGGELLEKTIVNRSKTTKVKTEFDLGELHRLMLLKKNYDQSKGDYAYEFTHGGRRMVLQLNQPG